MLNFGTAQVIAEHDASDEIDEVYHDIRQTMRVTGVNLIFRTWAGYTNALPIIWKALSPAVSTRAFEQAADQLRARTVDLASSMARLSVPARIALGPSQAYQIEQAVLLYHYINPKLLLLTSALRLAMDPQAPSTDDTQHNPLAERLPRGEPPGMYPMEMVSDEPHDETVATVFKDIKDHYAQAAINSDYRTLALWPDYLAAAWQQLKPHSDEGAYRSAVVELQTYSGILARTLPCPVTLSRTDFDQNVESAAEVKEKTAGFERLLPPLLLNVALMGLDWRSRDVLRHSPFPIGAQ